MVPVSIPSHFSFALPDKMQQSRKKVWGRGKRLELRCAYFSSCFETAAVAFSVNDRPCCSPPFFFFDCTYFKIRQAATAIWRMSVFLQHMQWGNSSDCRVLGIGCSDSCIFLFLPCKDSWYDVLGVSCAVNIVIIVVNIPYLHDCNGTMKITRGGSLRP